MKLVQYSTAISPTTQLGIEKNNKIINVKKLSTYFEDDTVYTMDSIIQNSETQLAKLQALMDRLNGSDQQIEQFFEDAQSINYLPIVKNPEKIICIGLNYIDFVKESDGEIPLSPIIHNKFNNALAAHQQIIPLPGIARHVDYSVELVVVIGKEMDSVEEEDVDDYILGYTVGNDFSDRKLQHKTSQWLLGKSLDYFAPTGPNLTTKDELPDLKNLDLSLKVNNKIVQNGNTKNMIFDVPAIVSYLSKHFTLKPGDLIFTGTPNGVIAGKPENERKWLSQNDIVEAKISGIGTLINQIK